MVFLRDAGERVRFFTVDGATDFFSKRGLENGVEIRATIEPDSQDVFLQVQQFRTLPYVAFLFTTHVMDAGCEELLATQTRHDLPATAGRTSVCWLQLFIEQLKANRASGWVLNREQKKKV